MKFLPGVKRGLQLSLGLTLVMQIVPGTAACQAKRPVTGIKPPVITEVTVAKQYEIKPAELPKPDEGESATRASNIIDQPENATFNLPKGFKVNVFAEGEFSYPRMMALAPNGDIFLADSYGGKIIVLRDANKDGVAEERFTFAEDLDRPFGMAFYKDWLYVAKTDGVIRFAYKTGQTKAAGDPEKLIELTAGGYNQHWTRNIIFSPDGTKMFVSVGSASNASAGEEPVRAAISVADPDGKNFHVFASGLRNAVGLAFNPASKELWSAVNERDGLGDDLVPDFVTSVKEGAFYGWPYSYIGQNEEPRLKGQHPELVKKAIVPDVLVASHSAALGMVFYQGKMFPPEYNGDAFVALHGSWNRQKLTGYKIIRIRFKDGKLLKNGYEDFMTGWLPDENGNEVWGRPVGLLVAADGSLLVCDDGAKKIWRVSLGK
jgi:glucose/arabinose dehydrogenase